MSVAAALDRTRTDELRALDATLAGVHGLVASGAKQVPRIFRVPPYPEELLLRREQPPATTAAAATVPVIDLSGDRAAVVDAVRAAAAEWGFFQVTGHGVPEPVMSGALAATRAFHEADGGEGSDKARLYSREPGKAAKYHCNFDLYQAPVANWRDTLYLRMAPDPPAADDLPEICRLSVFAHAMKMLDCTPRADVFVRFYDIHRRPTKVKDPLLGSELPSEIGCINFVPRKTRGSVSISLTYRNKWPDWNRFWFYYRVCSDESVAAELSNGAKKGSPLVSVLEKCAGRHLPPVVLKDPEAIRSGDAFALTARFQISQDLVEEWMAIGMNPLCSATSFEDFAEKDGYWGPTLLLERPADYHDDEECVKHIKKETRKICGPYLRKESEFQLGNLGRSRRLNRAFDAMGVEYAERPLVDESKDEAESSKAKGKGVTRRGGRSGVVPRRKVTEVGDIRIGRLIAKPLLTSQGGALESIPDVDPLDHPRASSIFAAGMAPKKPQARLSTSAFDNDVSVADLPTFAKPGSRKALADADRPTKRLKAPRVESAARSSAEPAARVSAGGAAPREGRAGSEGVLAPTAAHKASDAQLACRIDFRRAGILPGGSDDASKLVEFSQRAFAAPEVERDLLKLDSVKLDDALSFHLASAAILARSRHNQNDLYIRKIEREKEDLDILAKKLTTDLEVQAKKAEDERTSRKASQKEAEKLKREAGDLRRELSQLRNAQAEKDEVLKMSAEEVVSRFRECLRSIGVETDGPSERTANGLIRWLRSEMEPLENHMALGRDYAAVTGIKAIGHSLVDAGCSHIVDLPTKEVDYYWRTPEAAKALGKRFFEEFWLAGGNDMSLMQSAVGRGKTPEEKTRIRQLFSEYISAKQAHENEPEDEASPPEPNDGAPESSAAAAARDANAPQDAAVDE